MALKPNEQDLLDRVQSGLGIGGTWEPSATGAVDERTLTQYHRSTAREESPTRLLGQSSSDGKTGQTRVDQA